MKVMLKDVGNHDLWSVDIGPRAGGGGGAGAAPDGRVVWAGGGWGG